MHNRVPYLRHPFVPKVDWALADNPWRTMIDAWNYDWLIGARCFVFQ